MKTWMNWSFKYYFVFAVGSIGLMHQMYAQEGLPTDFDSYVAEVQETFSVPGVAVSIVLDGKAVLVKGYGIKKSGKQAQVDSKTLFAIASNTKAFTATALALLAEEGKIGWDTPVTEYLPGFRLSDPNVTREITLRDLLAHRSGLGQGAGGLLLWPRTTYSRKEIVRRLRFVPLAMDFRSTYGYTNVLYLVAGEVIEKVSGQTWEDFIITRIFKKLGMTNSTVGNVDIVLNTNVAGPNKIIEKVNQSIIPASSENHNPAGGVISCADDMAKWMICLLDSGRVNDNTRLFSPPTIRELWSPVTPMPIEKEDPELWPLNTKFKSYALGFRVRNYRGKILVYHTGGLSGYTSCLAMIPELKLGITVLTNQRSSEAYQSIIYRTLDYYLDGKEFDWINAYQAVRLRSDSITADKLLNIKTSRNMKSHPSLPLIKYVGTYNDKWYGDIRIVLKKGKLEIRFIHTPSLIGKLEHYQYDTFIARWRYLKRSADAFVTFKISPKKRIDSVKMEAVSPAADFSYDFHDLVLRPVTPKSD